MGGIRKGVAEFALLLLFPGALVFVAGCENPAPSSLRVLTYNIHHGANSAGEFNLDAVVDTIRQSGADVIALQEVDRVWDERSANYDEARYIASELDMHFTFGATIDHSPLLDGYGEYGIMILSRYAIVKSRFHLLPGDLEQRGVLYAVIRTPLGDAKVACTHLGLSADDRKQQVSEILAWLPATDGQLLMGDFNTEPGAEELGPLKTRFFDLQGAAGLGDVGTFLLNGTWVRVDYIFAAPQWKPDFCVVLPDQGSDHLPVSARVEYIETM